MGFLFSRQIDTKYLKVVYGRTRLDEQGGVERLIADSRINKEYVHGYGRWWEKNSHLLLTRVKVDYSSAINN